jgi:succinate dehydrogenase/fumarate reductase flavoprotein subunit
MRNQPDRQPLAADVLVIGGGIAGTWAATAAARTGARVILAEKGWCGTSGVAATAGPGHWWVPPDPALRAQAIERRHEAGLGLSDPDWMARVLDTTWRTLPTLSDHYAFPRDEAGVVQYRALRGPEYMKAMRTVAEQAGVTILDHTPALGLLRHADGSIAGARLWRRKAQRALMLRAGAVVLAAGGCAFRSHLLGSANLTGDGLLMAAESGAALSGMEFSAYYTVAPAHTSMTRSMSYAFATYSDASGREFTVRPGQDGSRDLARVMLEGPVFCHLGRTPADIRDQVRRISPNVPLVFDRLGIDPYRDRFEVTLHGEGTVRGTGGVVVADHSCQTDVPGLFAAGDTATRELVAGAISGGGAQNSAWALASGIWSGTGAAEFARDRTSLATRPAELIGQVWLPRGNNAAPDSRTVMAAVSHEMHDYDRNLFRTVSKLNRSLGVLEDLSDAVRSGLSDAGEDPLRAREAAALVACGRWSWEAALARRESRGLHQREDAPWTDPSQAARRLVGGIDHIWTRSLAPVGFAEAVA